MAVGVKGVALGGLLVDTAAGEVHVGQPPGGGVRLLAVDGDVDELAAVWASMKFSLETNMQPEPQQGP